MLVPWVYFALDTGSITFSLPPVHKHLDSMRDLKIRTFTKHFQNENSNSTYSVPNPSKETIQFSYSNNLRAFVPIRRGRKEFNPFVNRIKYKNSLFLQSRTSTQKCGSFIDQIKGGKYKILSTFHVWIFVNKLIVIIAMSNTFFILLCL